MQRSFHQYKCNCGEPIEPTEDYCLSCQNHYETKYGSDVAHYAIRGYEDGLVVLEAPNGEVKKITQSEYQQMEANDLVWYSFRGVADIKSPK